jgi:hypothetical protein
MVYYIIIFFFSFGTDFCMDLTIYSSRVTRLGLCRLLLTGLILLGVSPFLVEAKVSHLRIASSKPIHVAVTLKPLLAKPVPEAVFFSLSQAETAPLLLSSSQTFQGYASHQDIHPSLDQRIALKKPEMLIGRLPLTVLPPQIELPPAIKRAKEAFFWTLLFANGTNRNITNGPTAVDNVVKNIKQPFQAVAKGTKLDNNSFLINYVAHPVDWFLMGTYLKARGASDKEALITSQLMNLYWEFVAEGTYIAPSGKDLVTDLVSSVAGIYAYKAGVTKPLTPFLNKIEHYGQHYGLQLKPQIAYNPYSRGVRVASVIVIHR